jgi:hypothetical protein
MPAKIWVHGHVHESRDYVIERTRVIANPRCCPRNSSLRSGPRVMNVDPFISEEPRCMLRPQNPSGKSLRAVVGEKSSMLFVCNASMIFAPLNPVSRRMVRKRRLASPTCAESTPHNNRINGLAKKLALHF